MYIEVEIGIYLTLVPLYKDAEGRVSDAEYFIVFICINLLLFKGYVKEYMGLWKLNVPDCSNVTSRFLH